LFSLDIAAAKNVIFSHLIAAELAFKIAFQVRKADNYP
jgi:hypothetical protein